MSITSKRNKIFTFFLMLLFFCLDSFSFASPSKEGEIAIEFKGQIMSADLQGLSLKVILEKLKREKGIWFKGEEPLLEEKVSVRFEDLPLQEGLRRILSCVNHILVFDQDKRPVGLFILGTKSPGWAVLRDAGVVGESALFSQPVRGPTVSRNPFETFQDAPPPGNPKTISKDTVIRKDFSPPEHWKTKMSEMPVMGILPSPENPFSENIFQSPKNPFAENILPESENPFAKSMSSSPDNPFDDPFGSSLNP